jgi:hypothetical protein
VPVVLVEFVVANAIAIGFELVAVVESEDGQKLGAEFAAAVETVVGAVLAVALSAAAHSRLVEFVVANAFVIELEAVESAGGSVAESELADSVAVVAAVGQEAEFAVVGQEAEFAAESEVAFEVVTAVAEAGDEVEDAAGSEDRTIEAAQVEFD